MDQSPRVENGLIVSGISAKSGFFLMIWVTAASTSLTGSELRFVAPTPRIIKVQPGARVTSLRSLVVWRFGMYPLARIGVFGVNGGKIRFLGGVCGVEDGVVSIIIAKMNNVRITK